MTPRAGFIGLGNQGKPIAAHLAPAAFESVTLAKGVGLPQEALEEAGVSLPVGGLVSQLMARIYRVIDPERS